MNTLTLEPFSAVIDLELQRPIPAAEWQALFNVFLESLAQKSAAVDNTVIGHIKGFAQLPQDGFIQVSVVSAARPATSSVRDDAAVSCAQLTLALNFLVYGLPFQQAKTMVEQSAEALAQNNGGSARLRKISDPAHPSHNHD